MKKFKSPFAIIIAFILLLSNITVPIFSDNTGTNVAFAAAIDILNNSTIIKSNSSKIYVNGVEGMQTAAPLKKALEKYKNRNVQVNGDIAVIDYPYAIDPTNKKLWQEINSFFKYTERKPYMIYYGALTKEVIAIAKTYPLVIIHPMNANATRAQIKSIQQGVNPKIASDDVKVLGYISIGEDLRTINLTDEQMLKDKRFIGNGVGPRIDPRGSFPNGGPSLDGITPIGNPSPAGSGFASWYLDDNDYNGKPDRNKYFLGAFVNAGDPEWYKALDKMSLDGIDKLPGLAEILTTKYGRGLGMDGVFLDTIDTCAPNFYTDSSSGNQSEFEWTAPGFAAFMERLRLNYPEKLILQNRGLFFMNPALPQYKYCTRPFINYLLFESYRLNSNTSEEFSPTFFPDNKYNYAPKIMAEANRPDGFVPLSLGYAEGPVATMSSKTLLGKSLLGAKSLMTDIDEAQNIMGFRHYITDAGIGLVNSFVKNNTIKVDKIPPHWASTYNDKGTWPPSMPTPRVGIQQAITGIGTITIRWDVALDYNKVNYALYYQTEPFDFISDPTLSKATKLILAPEIGDGYADGAGADRYPYQETIKGLEAGKTYYLLIRAFDDSAAKNEEKNQVFLIAAPQ